ncbi:hypothetical protein N7533_008793 [Penicillium manginii]|uniref:uncharacterized protein n=1 Tax=Penicillium manginii TaxID=203109 RepID=UPI002547123C|nr:uncharacterized protein N7533_008793 [Penicillium manginii]KAJ5743923.1 hypothetical protein N7533_008793 [Penicillium manginii]
MDIDGMTVGETPGYPNLLDPLRNEDDNQRDMMSRPDNRKFSLFSDIFGCGGDTGTFSFSSLCDGRLYSAYLGQQTETPESLQSSEKNLGPTEPFSRPSPHDKPLSLYNEMNEIPYSKNTKPASKRKPTRIRRQNRSCDPCRSAKRACDLPLHPSPSRNLPLSACSMCKLRGRDCTVIWRTNKQSSNTIYTSASPSSDAHHEVEGGPVTVNEQGKYNVPSVTSLNLSIHESSLNSNLMRREACSERLAVYIDVFDIPVSDLLSGGCILPCHSVGVAALTSLGHNSNMAAIIDRTQLSIKDSWNIDSSPHLPASAVPHPEIPSIHHAMMISQKFLNGSPLRLDHNLIFVDPTLREMQIPKRKLEILHMLRGEKAKEMVFTKIAARKSFRLGLSLLLFGTILYPTGTDRSDEFENDSTYAFQEGISRLRMLCSEARIRLVLGEEQPTLKASPGKRFQPTITSPPWASLRTEESGGLLDLIVALEWLVDISQSVAIALFPKRDLVITPSILDHSTNINHPVGDELEFQGMATKVLDETNVSQDMEENKSVTQLLSQCCSDSIIQSALSESGSLVVLLWKLLARLTQATRDIRNGMANFEGTRRIFDTTLMTIGVWRTTFGPLNPITTDRLQRATADLRRSVIFCATDGDLAILIFHKLSCQIERHLAGRLQPSSEHLRERMHQTANYRSLQRLTSAIRLSSLASVIQGSWSRGEAGLKANIEDITAHPHPTMVVQAYELAATGLAEEIRSSVSTSKERNISDLSGALQNCLRGLRGVRRTLVMYPFTERDEEDFGSSPGHQ